MKKIFFFAAALVATVSANAALGDPINFVTADTDSTLFEHVWADEHAVAYEDANLTVEVWDGGDDWTVKGKITETFTVAGQEFNNGYIQGVTNGGVGKIDKDGTTSAHVRLYSDENLNVNLAGKYNDKKGIYVAHVPVDAIEELDYTDMSAYIDPSVFSTDATADGKKGVIGVNAADNTPVIGAPLTTNLNYWTAITVPVKPGFVTFVWVEGSKIMISGLSYAASIVALENTEAAVKATKAVVNGQLVIRRGDKEFNAMGAQL